MADSYYPITVTVVGPDEHVWAGATVAIVKSPVVLPEIARLTDDAGQCRLALRPGEYTFEAHGGEDLHARETISVESPKTLVMHLRSRTA